MRRGILGSIAALAAGAGSAWGQAPADAPAGGYYSAMGSVIPASGPAPVIMPPIAVGPPGDPMGLGPTVGLGPPPGPMYPPPGPYGAPMFQPPPGGQGGGPGGDGCGYAAPHWWFDGEYLLWFAKGQPVGFPLLTTSAPTSNGLLGPPSTIQLVRGEDISYVGISGLRLTGGFYGDADRRFGALVSGFYTEQKGVEKRFATSPTGVGIPLLARPFIDTNSGFSSLVVANAALGTGSALVSPFPSTAGVEADGVWNLFRTGPESKSYHSLDYIFGYKFLQNTEELRIDSFTTLAGLRFVPVFQPGPFGVPVQVGFRLIPTGPPVPVGGVTARAPATVQVTDRFRAS